MPHFGSFNSNVDSTWTEVNCDKNSFLSEEQCWEEAECQQQVFLILQRLITCSDAVIYILKKSPKVDQLKKSVKRSTCQCSNLGTECGSFSSPLNREVALSYKKSDRISATLNKVSESRKSLQHGMAQHDSDVDNNETQNDSGFNEDSGGLHRRLPTFDSRIDFDKLERNNHELSQCCFYFSSMDSQAAKDLLRKKPTGTFLIRDSSHFQYLYSLSVKTERGATSVRIMYNNGLFQFDCDERIRSKLPMFDSVLGLLDFHVMVTHEGVNKSWQWEENSGKKGMKVTLTKPLKNSVPTLGHLSRVKINQCLDNTFLSHLVDNLPLISNELKVFIKDYPYRI